MPLAAFHFRVYFFRGYITLKNRTYCPLSSHDTSSLKDTCLLIYSKEVPDGLYGTHLHCEPGQLLKIGKEQLGVSWESNSACRKASGRGATLYLHGGYFFFLKFKYLKYLVLYKNIVTPYNGLVVTPDWFGETALGSSCHPVKGQVI
jgi:hypothetical protein